MRAGSDARAPAVDAPCVDVIVPTIGASPHLEACLDAVLGQQGVGLSVLLVEQRRAHGRVPDCVRRLESSGRGFAAAANAGLAATDAPLVALVNDDAVVAEGWLAALAAALVADPGLAAVQGAHLLGVADAAAPGAAGAPADGIGDGVGGAAAGAALVAAGETTRRLDGVGLAFNRWWQAVQIGHGLPASALAAAVEAEAPDRGRTFEVFGVSATAALYRRRDLARAALGRGREAAMGFDESLESYYEDVELACRLRACGRRSAWVRGAAVEHAGSASEHASPGPSRERLVLRNRLLVLARLLGRRFPLALPRILARDLIDGARGGGGGLAMAAAAWCGALRRLPAFAHLGPPRVPISTLRGLGAERANDTLIGNRK
ncbi:MAG TPA: glycosyltransferase family 2 protein [Thermoanaerobaculia bacterium]|nr:glycosyltransferase family 2 protein [Thermoanaerobaculia bacterium]